MSIRNNLTLYGNSVREPEMRGSDRNRVARFTIAVSRGFNGEAGQKDTDFIDCVAFGRTAELVEKFAGKGRPILINGEVRNQEPYVNREGQKVYPGNIIQVLSIAPCGKKEESGNTHSSGSVQGDTDEELPY